MFPQVLCITLSQSPIRPPSGERPHNASMPDFTPHLSVLVVEDNRDIARLVVDYLESRGRWMFIGRLAAVRLMAALPENGVMRPADSPWPLPAGHGHANSNFGEPHTSARP